MSNSFFFTTGEGRIWNIDQVTGVDILSASNINVYLSDGSSRFIQYQPARDFLTVLLERTTCGDIERLYHEGRIDKTQVPDILRKDMEEEEKEKVLKPKPCEACYTGTCTEHSKPRY